MAEKFSEQEQEQKQVENEERIKHPKEDEDREDVRDGIEEAWKAFPVKALDRKIIEDISTLLDKKTDFPKNWEHLARQLQFDEDAINAMKRDHIGGGHPARDFLTNLKARDPDTTLNDIISKCKAINRVDIASFLKQKTVDKICDLSPEVLENLAEKLSCTDGSVKGWQSLAGLYDYSPDEIQQFGAKKGVYAHFSPTMVLFDVIRASDGNMTLGELADVLSKIGRNDVIEKFKSTSKLSIL